MRSSHRGAFSVATWWLAALLAVNQVVYTQSLRGVEYLVSEILIAALLLALAGAAIRGEPGRRHLAGPAFWAPAGFLLWMAVDFAAHGGEAFAPVWPIGLALMVVLFWAGAAATGPATADLQRKFLGLYAGLAVAESLLGLAQYGWPDRLLIPFTGDLHHFRVSGTFVHPNLFGGFVAAAVPLLAQAAGRRGGRWRWPARAGLAVCLAALALAMSRGALAGLAAGLAGAGLAVALARGRRAWGWVGAAAAAALAIYGSVYVARFAREYFDRGIGVHAVPRLQQAFVGNREPARISRRFHDFCADGRLDARDLVLAAALRQEFLRDPLAPSAAPGRNFRENLTRRFGRALGRPDAHVAARLMAAYSGWLMWLDHPGLGVGPGNYQRLAPDYLFDSEEAPLRLHAHSLPLQMLVELGLPGLLAWAGLCAGVAVPLWRSARASPPGRLAPGFFLGWSLLAVLVQNLVDITILYHPAYPFLLAILAFGGGAGAGGGEG